MRKVPYQTHPCEISNNQKLNRISLKAFRKKKTSHLQIIGIKLVLVFSLETWDTRDNESISSKFWEYEFRNVHLAESSIKYEGRIKTILDMQGLRMYITPMYPLLRKLPDYAFQQNKGEKPRKRKTWDPGNSGSNPGGQRREVPGWELTSGLKSNHSRLEQEDGELQEGCLLGGKWTPGNR